MEYTFRVFFSGTSRARLPFRIEVDSFLRDIKFSPFHRPGAPKWPPFSSRKRCLLAPMIFEVGFQHPRIARPRRDFFTELTYERCPFFPPNFGVICPVPPVRLTPYQDPFVPWGLTRVVKDSCTARFGRDSQRQASHGYLFSPPKSLEFALLPFTTPSFFNFPASPYSTRTGVAPRALKVGSGWIVQDHLQRLNSSIGPPP